MIDTGHRLGRRDRLPLGHQADPSSQQQGLGHRGGGCERDEGIVGPRVADGRTPVATPRAHRYVGVLGIEERLEAALLHLTAKLCRGHGVAGEDSDAVVHGAALKQAGRRESIGFPDAQERS